MNAFDFDAAAFELAGGANVKFTAGQQIFGEGDPGKVMYLVSAGEVEISAQGASLARLWPGDVFGEMSMIDGSARSATAVAKSDTQTIAMDQRQFLALIREQPDFALYLLKVLSVRVRELNSLI